MRLFIFAFLFCRLSLAGTNTINTQTPGTIIRAAHVNVFEEALTNNLVPRNSSGVPTAEGGGLGDTTYNWATSYISKIFFGDAGSTLFIGETGTNSFEMDTGATSTQILFKINGTTEGLIDVDGVDGSYLKTSSVTTAKVADANITYEKLEAKNYSISSSSGSFLGTSTSYADITNLSTSLTTHGRPVILFTYSTNVVGTAVGPRFEPINGTSSPECNFKFVRTSTDLGEFSIRGSFGGGAGNVAPGTSPGIMIDVPSAGTYTYKMQYLANTANDTCRVIDIKLVAIEL